MSKWTKWKVEEGTWNFPFRREVVKLRGLPDGRIQYKRLRANVEAESAPHRPLEGRIFQDIEGKIPATEDGQPVARYNCQYGPYLSQSDPSLRPVYRESGSQQWAFDGSAKPGDTTMVQGPSTPKPVITGPGEYRARDGRKAVVIGMMNPVDGYSVHGLVGPLRLYWTISGSYNVDEDENPLDIIAPWTDQPEAEAEMWVNVFQNLAGEKINTPIQDARPDVAEGWPGFAFIGTFKLVKEPE